MSTPVPTWALGSPTRKPAPRSRNLAEWALIIGTVGIVLTGLLIAEFRRPLNSDSAWLLYLARRVLEGDRLYVDLIEINPPLVVWLQLPVALLSRSVHLDLTTAFRMAVLLWIAVCTALCGRIVARSTWTADERRAILLLLVLVLLGWTRAHFGEREHIAFAGLLPYLFLTATLAEERVVPIRLRMPVAVCAAIGFALKPHFLLVWLVCLGFGWWKSRSFIRPGTAENATIAGLLLLYAVAVAVITPEYLQLLILLGPVYRWFAEKNVAALLLNSLEALGAGAAVLSYALLRRSLRRREWGDVFALATLAFLLAVLIQGKGFSYHYYPVSGCTLLLCGLLVLDARALRVSTVQRLAAAILGFLLVVGIGSGVGWSLVQLWRKDPVYQRQEVMARYIRDHAHNGSVLRLGYEDNFPLVDEAGATWAMRFPNLWFIQPLYRRLLDSGERLQFRQPSEMSGAERWCYEAVLQDLVRRRPSLVMINRPFTAGISGAVARIDYFQYFARDLRFKAALQAYRSIPGPPGYSVFVRAEGGS